MTMKFQIEVIDDLREEHREEVYAILHAHNQQANPEFWEALDREENRALPVQLFAFDGAHNIIGGLFGTTHFAWLKTDVMAVAEAARGRGIGRALLKRAEEIAVGRGCCHAYVDTMAYQAPEFYKKAGYAITGQLENWDSRGNSKYFLVKSIGVLGPPHKKEPC
jgi:GNAT superfamily N-acetyltransferase